MFQRHFAHTSLTTVARINYSRLAGIANAMVKHLSVICIRSARNGQKSHVLENVKLSDSSTRVARDTLNILFDIFGFFFFVQIFFRFIVLRLAV